MTSSVIGGSVIRVEDPRLVVGAGTYVDDIVVQGALWAVMVRSPIPHGWIVSIETESALAMPGVVGIFSAADLDLERMPVEAPGATDLTRRPVLAVDTVRFVGESVAVVVAATPLQAVDAAESVWVEFEDLPAVATPQAALADGAPLLFPELGTNVVLSGALDDGDDGLDDAEVVVDLILENQRMAAVPLEANNALAFPRQDGGVDVMLGSQGVHAAQRRIASTLGMDRDHVHVSVPDMGGGFGAKIATYPEQVLIVELTRRLGRPVRWRETRTENLVAMAHGRAQHHKVRLGATSDGVITGARFEVIQEAGAYPLFGAHLAAFTQRMASGPYRIPKIDFRWRAVLTNTTPVHAYRGAGRPEAALTLERMVDLLAARLQLDPAEVRRRNFIDADEFPYTTATGEHYDSGDYAAALKLALSRADYEGLRSEQAARRASNHRIQLGIGLSSYVEVTAPAGRQDWGAVEVHHDHVVVSSGASSHGQGHETTFSQIVAGLLGVPLERVRFVQADTDAVVTGGGTMGSRSMQMVGSALLRAGGNVIDKARRIVAHHFEAAWEDTILNDGRIGVIGVPDTGLTIFEVAGLASDPSNLPDGEEPGLAAEDRWVQPEATVPFGTHVSVVEVDIENGEVTILRHIACDDCGRIFNRLVVDGQVHGGVAQGIGQALFEGVGYDENANPTTTNLASYLLPIASTLPLFEIDHTETATDQNPLGAKGIGEAGTIGSGPAVVNAVHDAIRPFGVDHLDMPLTPGKIWTALSQAEG